MVEYKLTHFPSLCCLLLQVVSGLSQDLRTAREFWNFVGAVAKRPCMPNTVPYCKEIEEVKVILPSAYDSLRSRFRRHNLWLEEGLYVRLPYGHEDPKTYFYYDDQSHHYNFKPPKVVTRFRPQDVPRDLVTGSSERRTGIWAHETHEPHSIGHQDHHDSSFHDQVILNNVVDHLNNRTSIIDDGVSYRQIFPVSPTDVYDYKDPEFYVPFVLKAKGQRPIKKDEEVVKKTQEDSNLLDYVLKYATQTALEALHLEDKNLKLEIIDLIVDTLTSLKSLTSLPEIIPSLIPSLFWAGGQVNGVADREDLKQTLQDLSSASSNLSPVVSSTLDSSTGLTAQVENHTGRYIFLLGIVPAIAGSLLALGLEPLQILLIAAYIVTSYLFLIENQLGAEKKKKKRKETSDARLVEELIQTAFEKSMALLDNLDLGGLDSSSDFALNDFLTSNKRLLPLLNLLDEKSVAYIREFDKIVQEIVQERQ